MGLDLMPNMLFWPQMLSTNAQKEDTSCHVQPGLFTEVHVF